MKAIELARKLSERAEYLEKHAEGDTMAREAAAELRRLAEVNAELLKALEKVGVCLSMHKRYKSNGDGYLDEAKEIIFKAKEQQ